MEPNTSKEHYMIINDDISRKLLAENTNPPRIGKERTGGDVLSVVDVVLSVFVVTPLVVSCWRGLWMLVDMHSEYFPAVPTFLIAIAMHILFALFQNSFHYLVVESEKHWSMKIVTHLLRRFYTYVFLWVTVLHWRGGWLLTEYYTNLRFTKELKATKETSLICLLVGAATFLILLCMRCLRNAIAPPFALCLDKRNYVFRFPTMFSPNIKFGWLRVLDCVISVGVVGNLVVVLWRAIWVAVDLVVIPQNFTCSAWACLVLGLIATGLVFRLQNCMKRVCTDLSGIIKVILADAYILLSIIAAILFWSGIWNLLNIYFLPGDLLLSCTLSHLISLAFLYLIGCSNSLLVRGVMQDGSGEEGECVVFPCNYLRTIFEQERTACLGQLGLTEENSAS